MYIVLAPIHRFTCELLHVFFVFIFSFNQKLTLAHQQMSADYEKLKQEDTEKTAKLQNLMFVFPPPSSSNSTNLISFLKFLVCQTSNANRLAKI